MIEGLPAIVLGLCAIFVLPEDPSRAAFLSEGEKSVIATRLRAEANAQDGSGCEVLFEPKLYALGLVNFAILFGSYGVQLWLPQIVQEMISTDTLAIGVIASLVFLASIPAMTWWGRSSDKHDERIGHLALPALFAAFWFVAAAIVPPGPISLTAIALASIGVSCMQPCYFAFVSSLLRGRGVASGTALVMSISNAGSFLGPLVTGMLKQRTGGYGGGMLAMALVLAAAACIVFAVGRAHLRAAPGLETGR